MAEELLTLSPAAQRTVARVMREIAADLDGADMEARRIALAVSADIPGLFSAAQAGALLESCRSAASRLRGLAAHVDDTTLEVSGDRGDR